MFVEFIFYKCAKFYIEYKEFKELDFFKNDNLKYIAEKACRKPRRNKRKK